MRIGFARSDITPAYSVPLAGYFTRQERMSASIRDHLFCRAMAIEDGPRRAAVVAMDLLLTPPHLAHEVRRRLADKSLSLLLHATHTHSGYGGLWDVLPARFMLGNYRRQLVEFTISRVVEAVQAAFRDLQPARVGARLTRCAGMAENRRDPKGPVDEDVVVIKIKRQTDTALVVSMAAHPVIVAERDPFAISADFPGEVVRRIESAGYEFALFLNGGLGGLGVVFPRQRSVSVEENLALMAAPIAEEALKTSLDISTERANLRCASRTTPLGACNSNPFHEDRPLLAIAALPLRMLLNAAFRNAAIDRFDQHAISIGRTLLLGTPADLGVGLSHQIKGYAIARGFAIPAVLSQCDGYIGYLHRPEDYQKTPSRQSRSMARYENALAIFGHGSGALLERSSRSLIDELTAAQVKPEQNPPIRE